LTWVGRFRGVTLVPDRREDGTNVVGVPADGDFVFSYGPGSFARHVAETRRLGLALRIVRAPQLSWDVDLPADLAAVSTGTVSMGTVSTDTVSTDTVSTRV
jgi:2-phospho-L-lactate guanylyltransferase (CobY/MobA/RfbA family)